jgi:hypothetical protein
VWTTALPRRSLVTSPAARRTDACSLAEEADIPPLRASSLVVQGWVATMSSTAARVRPSSATSDGAGRRSSAHNRATSPGPSLRG